MRLEDPTIAWRMELLLLRLFAVAPLLFLAVALVIDFSSRGSFLDSISAYYGSPVRDVFVGSLVAVGIVYVVYRGSTDLEDRALDLAGFFVVIVALVPYNYETMLEAMAMANMAGESMIARRTLFWVLVAWIMIAALFYSVQLRWRKRVAPAFTGKSQLIQVLSSVVWTGFVAFALVWLIAGQPFATLHFVAAVLVILCLIVVVAMHAFRYEDEQMEPRKQSGLKLVYTAIAAWMFAGLVLGAVLYAFGNNSWVFITEVVEIGAFVAFWVINLFVARRALIRDLHRSEYASNVT